LTTLSAKSLAHSFRSPSSSSMWYHIRKPPMDQNIPIGRSGDPALVKQLLELAEKSSIEFRPNIYRSTVFQAAWFILIMCVIYFAFIGFPLWNGIVVSIL
jgi:hypothetical protein